MTELAQQATLLHHVLHFLIFSGGVLTGACGVGLVAGRSYQKGREDLLEEQTVTKIHKSYTDSIGG